MFVRFLVFFSRILLLFLPSWHVDTRKTWGRWRLHWNMLRINDWEALVWRTKTSKYQKQINWLALIEFNVVSHNTPLLPTPSQPWPLTVLLSRMRSKTLNPDSVCVTLSAEDRWYSPKKLDLRKRLVEQDEARHSERKLSKGWRRGGFEKKKNTERERETSSHGLISPVEVKEVKALVVCRYCTVIRNVTISIRSPFVFQSAGAERLQTTASCPLGL